MTDLGGEVINFPEIRPQSPIPVDDDLRKPEIIPIELQNFPGPGVLTVHILKGFGLSAPQYGAVSKQPETGFSNVASKTPRVALPITNHQSLLLPYAILECEKSEIFIDACQGTRENPDWMPMGRKKFDIFRSAKLTIRLYAGNPNSHCRGSQDTFLGYAKMNTVFGDGNSHQMEWLPIENGTGKLLVEVEYEKKRTLQIETSKKLYRSECCRLGVMRKLRKLSTNRFYMSLNIQKADILPHCDVVQSFLSPINNSLFIAPLKFIAQTRSHFCLYWPFIPGGHLFYHLQQPLRFQTERAKLYAAEILIALERLHEVDPCYYELKPKNILLDSVGHIVLCDLGFLHLETRNIEKTTDFTMDYLAPELLSGHILTSTVTTASKWWAFGSFLFEMLTGLPPFYDKNAEQRRHNILREPLGYSRYLSASAQDILNKLLSRNPGDRLGANGASEIKAHHFFDGLDWGKVARQEYEPVFKPHEHETTFRQEKKHPRDKNWLENQFSGWSWNTPPAVKGQTVVVESYESASEKKGQPVVVESHESASEMKAQPVFESHESASEKKDDWELVWQHEDQKFYFYNHSTKTKKCIFSNREKQSQKRYFQARSRTIQGGVACIHDVPNTNVDTFLPDAAQCQEALEAVLVNQYMHLIPALLKKYTINLNVKLEYAHTTPINYVTGLEDVETVRLFLENGADANLEHGYTMGGQPLLTAVKKGNQELTEILVQRTDRIPCTRALGHAVSKKDIPIVNILLANGVKCDFEDSDQPPEPGPCVPDWDWNLNTLIEAKSEPDQYIPPLVRAVLLGDVHLVQLLLSYGADANIGYHNLVGSLPDSFIISDHLNMRCGRPIQLAMELGHLDVIQLLLGYGAEIDLAQPVWQHHHCKMIPRAAHHEITAQLRSVATPWYLSTPKYDSMMSHVREYDICSHSEQDAVVPGAAVPGVVTKKAPTTSMLTRAYAIRYKSFMVAPLTNWNLE
ncbi:hypothetical protein BGW36DRAFT_428522 [Talaromyces proteolyticus]|uniref:Protein kinase domain-containing protein n=1 Tax=Talaromyces proteolyticus TaxID=1131652 RepID=A0AAD4PZM5_9EURO|nr:uncharacterized protein BGW36DRAFT_428522 [Talaromyces proteolyticus]KAH8696517.1 hypothetical protein BGW36DRAFT_428522 [Talaromyces proteolyticus]